MEEKIDIILERDHNHLCPICAKVVQPEEAILEKYNEEVVLIHKRHIQYDSQAT